MDSALTWLNQNAAALGLIVSALVALGGAYAYIHRRRKQADPKPIRYNPPPSAAGRIYYLSTRRLDSVYEQLPDEAYVDEGGQKYAWVDRASLDAPGDLGQRERRLRTSQRQLRILLNHWDRNRGCRSLAAALKAGDAIDSTVFYECESEFRVEDRDPADPLLTLTAQVDDYQITLQGSKEGFPGLFRSRDDGPFEPNSMIPDFFRGRQPMRLLALAECQTVDQERKIITGGALCLMEPPRDN